MENSRFGSDFELDSWFDCLYSMVGVSDVTDTALLEDGAGLLLPEAIGKSKTY